MHAKPFAASDGLHATLVGSSSISLDRSIGSASQALLDGRAQGTAQSKGRPARRKTGSQFALERAQEACWS
eukprot:6189120-Pleurochrysis_carterae.AAC.2